MVSAETAARRPPRAGALRPAIIGSSSPEAEPGRLLGARVHDAAWPGGRAPATPTAAGRRAGPRRPASQRGQEGGRGDVGVGVNQAEPGVNVERDRERGGAVVLEAGQHRAVAGAEVPEHRDQQAGVPALGKPVGLEGTALGGGDDREPASSRGAVFWDEARSCQSVLRSSPSAVTSRTMNPRWDRCRAIEAAADTAASNDDAAPSPRWASRRVSRNTVARDCQGCSSRRTISSPVPGGCSASARGAGRRRGGTRATVTSSSPPVATRAAGCRRSPSTRR